MVLVATQQDVHGIAQPIRNETADQIVVAQCLQISDPDDGSPQISGRP
jgi:hypothetical protein